MIWAVLVLAILLGLSIGLNLGLIQWYLENR